MLKGNVARSVRKLQPWQVTVLVALGYVLLVLLMTWPAVRYLSQQLIGNNEDTWIFYWNNWWLKKAITSGINPLQTSFLFFPEGTSLVAHSNSFLSSFLALVLETLVNSIAAYNLVLLFGLWLSALGMYLLVRDITEHFLASILAGFIFAFAPYHISQVMAHAHLGSIQWWPFYILFLRRALIHFRWRDAVLAGFFAALTIWTGLQLGILLVLWTFVYMLLFFWQRRSSLVEDRQQVKRTVTQTAVIVVIALLLALPLIGAVLNNWSVLSASASDFSEGITKQTDLLSYFVPPTLHPVWGDQFWEQFERFSFNGVFRPYIGFSVLILVLAAIISRSKEARIWLICGGIFLVLAAGSTPRFNGQVYEQLPLPYKWIGTVFPISAIRAPDRFNFLIVLTFSVLAGIGIAWLYRRHALRWGAGVLSLLVVIEYLLFPIPRLDLPTGSDFLNTMARDESDYALINYPMGYTDSKYWLYYQTIHEKPTVEGHVSRYTNQTYEFIANQPLLKAIYSSSDKPPNLPEDFFEDALLSPFEKAQALRNLQDEGFRYLLVNRQLVNEEELEKLDSLLPIFPIYQDQALTVFDLTRPVPINIGERPLPISNDVDLIEAKVDIDVPEADVELELLTQKTGNDPAGSECQLQLNGTSSKLEFSPLPGSSTWKDGDLVKQKLALAIPEDIDSGIYDLRITCPGSRSVNLPDRLYVGDSYIILLHNKIDLDFNDSIRLLGYRWWLEQDGLQFILEWQALEDVAQDYKYFIHLIDDDGNIVWQYDGIHCNWQCPSSQWAKDDMVSDKTIIPVAELHQGTYRIAVGLYEEQSGTRLTVRDAEGEVIPDNYYILDESLEIIREP